MLDLGDQAVATFFPRPGEDAPKAPLRLMRCAWCDLGQLSHTVGRGYLFGGEYGYRSGMNQTMRDHLKAVADSAKLTSGDVVVDIGANDGTFLSFFPADVIKVGFEPSEASREAGYGVNRCFFGSEIYKALYGVQMAKAVFSIAMFYDIEDLPEFACEVREILADDGVWVIEVQDMGFLGPIGAYDVICHEHLTFWDIEHLRAFLLRNGFTIESATLSYINGGSLRVNAVKGWRIDEHESLHSPWGEFALGASASRMELNKTIRNLLWSGKKIGGCGASTKGNVILQYCGLTDKEIFAISDRNPAKVGRVTPGTNIPIISESEMRAEKPDYLLALPWGFINELREREPWASFIVPFPVVKILPPLGEANAA